MNQNGRTVTAVVTADGGYVGALGPFPVAVPWWAEVASVVSHVEHVLGVPAMVLRILDVEGGDAPRDGHATYHVEALRPPADGVPQASLVDHMQLLTPAPGRAEWATADGLRDALTWADVQLRDAGRPPTGPVEQIKTWNLAGLFRIPTAQGPVWLKTTPHFGADEARAIGLLAEIDPTLVPTVLAAHPSGRRMLLDDVPGEDCWDPSPTDIRAAVGRLVTAQAAIAKAGTPTGLPVRRPWMLAEQFDTLLAGPLREGPPRDGPVPAGRAADSLTAAELKEAHALAARLPEMIIELEACGLPDTLVHGDLHPGNWRSDGVNTVLLDFADSHVGHPVLDGLHSRSFLPDQTWSLVAQTWVKAWSACVPGCDPARALTIGTPLAHLAYAVRYQQFLDGIETSERIYHEGDPAGVVRRAVASAKQLARLS